MIDRDTLRTARRTVERNGFTVVEWGGTILK